MSVRQQGWRRDTGRIKAGHAEYCAERRARPVEEAVQRRKVNRHANGNGRRHRIPEFTQPLHAVSRCIAGDQRCIDRADRYADHPIGNITGFNEAFEYARLVRTHRAAAL